MESARTLSLHIPLFQELFDTLPPEWRTEKVHLALLGAYRYELHCLINAAVHPDCLEPRIVMRPWQQSGEQWIAEFWVADAAIPWKSRINAHGQNTSQWRYAGTILFENGEVSTHH
jgi:hypothetical protein